ncbi:hypothetical protein [Vagococcus luciliae]|uniref:Zinc-ribbon domain-containing protein n=1 Tax=Vagococcus luciliae TaxID=2920380 RepID=A0ABY5NZ16_9ENTE|nr:hypothetical protein [Vagococcus luciliae]UUV98894.1 hypothetical protein G314FT_10520 [Vagococcus luciliae]
MITCKECGREINPNQKRCSYCKSRIIPITAGKVLKKTKKISSTAINKTVDTSSAILSKTGEGIKQIKETQQKKSIEQKKKKIEKLQKQIDKHDK